MRLKSEAAPRRKQLKWEVADAGGRGRTLQYRHQLVIDNKKTARHRVRNSGIQWPCRRRLPYKDVSHVKNSEHAKEQCEDGAD